MTIKLPSGQTLQWIAGAGDASLVESELTMHAEAQTDWFIDPATSEPVANAPLLMAAAQGDFQLEARVQVDFDAMFDAGVLFVHQAGDMYAKLCFELSPAGERTVVSVVTRGVSDDANGPAIDGDQVWLRVSRLGGALAFHWSTNGSAWQLLRYFQLGVAHADLHVGFCAQAPIGPGCTARFSEISWTQTTLSNVRDGS